MRRLARASILTDCMDKFEEAAGAYTLLTRYALPWRPWNCCKQQDRCIHAGLSMPVAVTCVLQVTHDLVPRARADSDGGPATFDMMSS